MYYSKNRWAYFREKSTVALQQLHSKKGGGLIFEGGPTFEVFGICKTFVAAAATAYQEPHFWRTEGQELCISV